MVLHMAIEILQMSWGSLIIWLWVAQKGDYLGGEGGADVMSWALKREKKQQQRKTC